MASDGKCRRKDKAPLCLKCRDKGWIFEWDRSKGRLTSPRMVPCRKNCPTAQKWKEAQK